MPRYEFIKGTSKKFWEIALSGKSFTTTYGRLGAAGQSTTKTFASPAEASKQYEKLVAEKVGKGYKPAGAAPAAAAPKPATLPKGAFRPARAIKVKALKKGATAPAHFGGGARLAKGEAWPVCKNCKRPMPLFVEMDLAKLKLPKKVAGLLQFFYCNGTEPLCEVECKSWDLNDRAMLLRVVPPNVKTTPVDPPALPSPVPARSLDFGPEKADPPNWEDVQDRYRIRYEDDSPIRPMDGDKLLGWPAWVQGAEWQKCPQCKKEMQNLLQLQSHKGLQHQWGDNGQAYLFVCLDHPTRVGFVWQGA
jgi:predicted DNA-binding WGR domain protein